MPWWPLLLSGAIGFLGMAWQLFFDVGLADEGFLWYGAQRVLEGELPLRDFQAYDPGRYFWSAFWMSVLGDNGIVSLRIGNAVLGTITVVLATWTTALCSSRSEPVYLLMTALIFTFWMVPAFKVADSFAAIVQLFALARLVQRPLVDRYFVAGFCWGMAATIGINHALYGCIAGLLALFYLRGPKLGHDLIAALCGAVIGYLPVLLLHAAPGFTAAFIDSIRLLFEYGKTNNEVPFPSVLAFLHVSKSGYLLATRETIWAVLFACAPAFWLWMAWRIRQRSNPTTPIIAAAMFLSLPYAHYAFSRADGPHIAISILPLLAALLALVIEAPRARRPPIFALISVVSVILTASEHPGYWFVRGSLTHTVTAGRDPMLVTWYLAAELQGIKEVARAAGTGQFFAGPNLPGAYALATLKSPTWEIYMIFPSLPRRQRAEIERIRSANVQYALISGQGADLGEDTGLKRTHPLILAYLHQCLPNRRVLPAQPHLTVRWSNGPQTRPGVSPRYASSCPPSLATPTAIAR
jgi:hypothetical protein